MRHPRAVRNRLKELWEEATGLLDADTSPLAKASINECLEVAEPDYDFEEMACAMETLADDCMRLSAVLQQEAERLRKVGAMVKPDLCSRCGKGVSDCATEGCDGPNPDEETKT
jgi:hypothetical protein